MKKDKIADIAEAVYHPEHIADNFVDIPNISDEQINALTDHTSKIIGKLVQLRINGDYRAMPDFGDLKFLGRDTRLVSEAAETLRLILDVANDYLFEMAFEKLLN